MFGYRSPVPTIYQLRGYILEETLAWLLRNSGYQIVENAEHDRVSLGSAGGGLTVRAVAMSIRPMYWANLRSYRSQHSCILLPQLRSEGRPRPVSTNRAFPDSPAYAGLHPFNAAISDARAAINAATLTTTLFASDHQRIWSSGPRWPSLAVMNSPPLRSKPICRLDQSSRVNSRSLDTHGAEENSRCRKKWLPYRTCDYCWGPRGLRGLSP